MDIAGAVKMLFLDPERAAHAAVLAGAVPERPVIGLEIVTGPGPPAHKLTIGGDVQVGAVAVCFFSQVVHAIYAFKRGFWDLNPIHQRCANR